MLNGELGLTATTVPLPESNSKTGPGAISDQTAKPVGSSAAAGELKAASEVEINKKHSSSEERDVPEERACPEDWKERESPKDSEVGEFLLKKPPHNREPSSKMMVLPSLSTSSGKIR